MSQKRKPVSIISERQGKPTIASAASWLRGDLLHPPMDQPQ
jgi:hypothetical protein